MIRRRCYATVTDDRPTSSVCVCTGFTALSAITTGSLSCRGKSCRDSCNCGITVSFFESRFFQPGLRAACGAPKFNREPNRGVARMLRRQWQNLGVERPSGRRSWWLVNRFLVLCAAVLGLFSPAIASVASGPNTCCQVAGHEHGNTAAIVHGVSFAGAGAVPVRIHPPDGVELGPRLGKGIFLVASRGLVDPNFVKSVVLLVAHGEEGAMGVVVNRPTQLPLDKALPDIKALQGRQDVVYIGGPVGVGQVTLLLRAASPPEDALHVFQDVYFSGSLTTLMEYLNQEDPAYTVHAYAGYAGWGAGQLEGEVNRGDWHLVEADANTLFNTEPERIWRDLIRTTSGHWVKGEDHGPTQRLGMVRLSAIPGE